MHISCGMISALQWGSAACAGGAALFWFLASLVRLPPDQIRWDTIDHIVPVLRRQGRMNAAGAIFAAIAAGVQGVLIIMPTCIKLN